MPLEYSNDPTKNLTAYDRCTILLRKVNWKRIIYRKRLNLIKFLKQKRIDNTEFQIKKQDPTKSMLHKNNFHYNA